MALSVVMLVRNKKKVIILVIVIHVIKVFKQSFKLTQLYSAGLQSLMSLFKILVSLFTFKNFLSFYFK